MRMPGPNIYLKEVLTLPWLHVDLALVDVVDVGKIGQRVPHRPGGARATSQHRLLKWRSAVWGGAGDTIGRLEENVSF